MVVWFRQRLCWRSVEIPIRRSIEQSFFAFFCALPRGSSQRLWILILSVGLKKKDKRTRAVPLLDFSPTNGIAPGNEELCGPFPDPKETGLPMKKKAGQLNQIYVWY